MKRFMATFLFLKSLRLSKFSRSKGVSMLAAALSTFLIIFLTYAIARFAYLLTVDTRYRHLMQETLRVAQGIPNLWTYEPGTPQYKEAFDQLHEQFNKIAEQQRINLNDGTISMVSNSNNSAGTVKFGFLPPGSGCMTVNGVSLCNSQDESIVSGGGSVVVGDGGSLGSGATSDNTRKEYQNKLRNHPTEVVLCYDPDFLGVENRCVRAAGYPRLIQSEQIAMVMPVTTIAPTTAPTTVPPTTTVADSTSTVAGSTSTVAGSTSTVVGSTSTVAGWTTSTVAGSTTTVSWWITSTIASTSTVVGSSTTALTSSTTSSTTTSVPECFYSVNVMATIDCITDCSGSLVADNVNISVLMTDSGCSPMPPMQSSTQTLNGFYSYCHCYDSDGVYCSVYASRYGEPLPSSCSGDPYAFLARCDMSTCGSPVQHNFSKSHIFSYAPGTYYFDANCNQVGSPGRLCGTRTIDQYVRYQDSPISLIWGDKKLEDIEPQLVNFSLSGDSRDRVSLWFASADTPLLVYDPAHTGNITSAEQLFGNWTFGGKKSGDGKLVPWSDGYEALATFDSNRDGVVSGYELDKLGLWFDNNQNGVSEKGEVVTIKNANVSELFFKPSRESSHKGHKLLYAEPGFTALIGGKKVIGNSVDWFSVSASGSQTLSSKHWSFQPLRDDKQISFPALPSDNMSDSVSDNLSDDVVQPNKQGAKGLKDAQLSLIAEMSKKVSGIWEWKADGMEDGTAPRGMLELAGFEDGGGILMGRASGGGAIKSNASGVAHAIVVSELRGSFLPKTATTGVFQFTVNPDKPLSEQTLTEFKVSEDGKELKGISRQMAKSVSGDSILIDYHWTARKKIM